MKKIIAVFCVLLGLQLFADTARAQSADKTFQRIDPVIVGRILGKMGVQFEMRHDEYGRPRIAVMSRQIPVEQFEIYFFGCDNFGTCDSFTLWSWFRTKVAISHYWVNQFNSKARWGRAYLDTSDNPVFELDVNINGGVTSAYVEAMIRAYLHNLGLYAEHVKVVPSKK